MQSLDVVVAIFRVGSPERALVLRLRQPRRVVLRLPDSESWIKGGGRLEKYLGVSALKSFINRDLILERMVSFRLPEVEGLERDVKGLPGALHKARA